MRAVARIEFPSANARTAGKENSAICVQAHVGGAISYRDATPASSTQCLFFAMRRAILDHKSLVEGNSVVTTVPIGTVERFPVHLNLLDEYKMLNRGYNKCQESTNLIKAIEGQYRFSGKSAKVDPNGQ